jgi:hypothetical protein
MFVCHVIFDERSEPELQLRSDQNTWTEVLRWMFVRRLMFGHVSEAERLRGSEQKRWTVIVRRIFVWYVIFDQLSQWHYFLRSQQKRWIKTSCWPMRTLSTIWESPSNILWCLFHLLWIFFVSYKLTTKSERAAVVLGSTRTRLEAPGS